MAMYSKRLNSTMCIDYNPFRFMCMRVAANVCIEAYERASKREEKRKRAKYFFFQQRRECEYTQLNELPREHTHTQSHQPIMHIFVYIHIGDHMIFCNGIG